MQRSARFISIEDFIFLARKDRDKLRRLVKFLNFKDQKQKFAKMLGTMEEEDAYSETGELFFFSLMKSEVCLTKALLRVSMFGWYDVMNL